MNFVRSRLSLGNILGQRCRRVAQTWSHRGMCNKPQEVKTETHPAPAPAPAPAPRATFRVPGYKPSKNDRKILIWSGRFKTEDQIPEFVSYEMIDAARNKVRVKVCYAMVVASILACLVTVIMGKRAASRNESIIAMNLERKARWREEVRQEAEAAKKPQ